MKTTVMTGAAGDIEAVTLHAECAADSVVLRGLATTLDFDEVRPGVKQKKRLALYLAGLGRPASPLELAHALRMIPGVVRARLHGLVADGEVERCGAALYRSLRAKGKANG